MFEKVHDAGIIAGALVILLTITGCGSGGGTGPTPTFVPTPIVPASPEYVVGRGAVVRELEFRGRVAPVETEPLFFEADGRVEAVYVTRDQWVEEGTTVAELDIEDLLNQLELAHLSLQTTQNALEMATRDYERSLANAELNLRNARLQLAMAITEDTEPSVRIATVNLERATAALEEAEEEYDKALNRPWDPPGTIEGYEAWVTSAQWGYREAQAYYDQALQADQSHDYQVALSSAEVERAELELEWLSIGVDPVLTQTVQSAQVTVDGLQARLDRARIVAPFDGTILTLGVSEGRQVHAFEPVATLAGEEGLEIVADLSSSELIGIGVGMTGTAELPDVPGQSIPVRVRTLPRTSGPVEERDPATHIELTSDEGPSLEVDDPLTVRLVIEEVHDVLRLPPEAIRVYEGRRFVVVRDEEGQRRVDVDLGVIGDDWVEICEGLAEGQVVIAP
jgi:HlyD family secretion protein